MRLKCIVGFIASVTIAVRRESPGGRRFQGTWITLTWSEAFQL